MFLKAGAILLFYGVSGLCQAQVFWPEITIGVDQLQEEDEAGKPDGVIRGVDYYGLQEYENFDFGLSGQESLIQKQEETELERDPTPNARPDEGGTDDGGADRWKSYQEIQTEKLLRQRQEEEAEKRRQNYLPIIPNRLVR